MKTRQQQHHSYYYCHHYTSLKKIFSLWCLCLKICHAFSSPHHPPKQIPITVISGFLGSGKTTLLQNMLNNKQGLKIAVIVNDVASVNIDSKLVSESNSADGMVQLQNGCACCSISDELLGSVSELVTLSDMRGESDGFDHIVVEMSGVADPKGVRSQFQAAIFYDMPIMDRVRLDTMLTVVDCSVFLKHLRSSKMANRDETPELFYREGEEIPEEPEISEEWMEDLPPLLLEALLAGDNAAANSPRQDTNNAVADLLVSQTELADVVLLNKVDLADKEEDVSLISQIVTALNPRATVKRTSFGEIPLKSVLAVANGEGVVEAGLIDDHRDAIEAAEKTAVVHHDNSDDVEFSNGHDHKQHEHSHSSHHHEHALSAEEHDKHGHGDDCTDADCKDTSHSHSHSHSHAAECIEPDCDDPSHSHSHSHNHAEECNDPNCDDPSHSHFHSHSHSHSSKTTLDQLGIGSFVYRARRPFHPQRLVTFLRHLPISRGLPEKTENDPALPVSKMAEDALHRVVRSKGFVWLGDSNLAANYWSHAGTSFELQCLGRWWATLPRAEWPQEALSTILADFDDPKHDEGDDTIETVGDRRQEVVFIGPGLLTENRESDITSCLDQCLLDDKEWEEYKSKRTNEKSLKGAFTASLPSKMLSY